MPDKQMYEVFVGVKHWIAAHSSSEAMRLADEVGGKTTSFVRPMPPDEIVTISCEDAPPEVDRDYAATAAELLAGVDDEPAIVVLSSDDAAVGRKLDRIRAGSKWRDREVPDLTCNVVGCDGDDRLRIDINGTVVGLARRDFLAAYEPVDA